METRRRCSPTASGRFSGRRRARCWTASRRVLDGVGQGAGRRPARCQTASRKVPDGVQRTARRRPDSMDSSAVLSFLLCLPFCVLALSACGLIRRNLAYTTRIGRFRRPCDRERASRHVAPHSLVQPRQPSAVAVVPDGVEAVLWTPSSNNEWGGTLWEVAIFAGNAVDLTSYRGFYGGGGGREMNWNEPFGIK